MSPPRDGESPSDDGPVDGDPDGSEPDDGSPTVDDPTHSDTPGGPATPVEPDDDQGAGEGPDDATAPDDSATNERAATDRVTASGHDGPAPNGGVGAAETLEDRRAEAEQGENSTLRTFVVDVVSSALAVLLVGVLLFAVSGVWPPMVAIESPSMTPHMKTGDLVFVMEEERFPGEGAVAGTGVVTHQAGQTTDYRKFARTGDVIVYKPDGSDNATPIIHRAMFWVEEGENWYEEAHKQSIGRYSECGDTPDEALPNCPAPHAGFITKGDANGVYDQVQSLSGPVKAQWVVGTAEVRIPKLGCIRLRTKGCAGGVRGAVCQVNGTRACMAGETARLAR